VFREVSEYTELTTMNVKGDKPNNYFVNRIDNDVFCVVTPNTLVDMYRHLGNKTTRVSSLHRLVFISLSREQTVDYIEYY
jgi:hypothetical protein